MLHFWVWFLELEVLFEALGHCTPWRLESFDTTKRKIIKCVWTPVHVEQTRIQYQVAAELCGSVAFYSITKNKTLHSQWEQLDVCETNKDVRTNELRARAFHKLTNFYTQKLALIRLYSKKATMLTASNYKLYKAEEIYLNRSDDGVIDSLKLYWVRRNVTKILTLITAKKRCNYQFLEYSSH